MTAPALRDLAGEDPYQLLGVPADAGTDQIRAAYRRLMRHVHPDLPTGDAARARLLTIARDILLDPGRRAEYDASVTSGEPETVDVEPEPSAWDSADVTSGVGQSSMPGWARAAPSPPPPGAHHHFPPPWSDHHFPPPAYQHAPPVHPGYPRTAYGTSYSPEAERSAIWAIALAFLCWPVGLIFGIRALWHWRALGPMYRALAVISVALPVALCIFPGVLWLVLASGFP